MNQGSQKLLEGFVLVVLELRKDLPSFKPSSCETFVHRNSTSTVTIKRLRQIYTIIFFQEIFCAPNIDWKLFTRSCKCSSTKAEVRSVCDPTLKTIGLPGRSYRLMNFWKGVTNWSFRKFSSEQFSSVHR